jgi:hypothetical protein
MSITLYQFERIDGLLSKQLCAGPFETCEDPHQYIKNSNRLFDACIDAMGFVYMDQFASAEDCAAAIVTTALLSADFVGDDA